MTGLDAPGFAMLLLGVSVLDLCWLRRFLGSLLRVVYRKIHRYETLTRVQCMGCKVAYDEWSGVFYPF
jgi:hypothetical protein